MSNKWMKVLLVLIIVISTIPLNNKVKDVFAQEDPLVFHEEFNSDWDHSDRVDLNESINESILPDSSGSNFDKSSIDFYKKVSNSLFDIKNQKESISTMNGDLSQSFNLFTLPGRKGLGFSLQLLFSNSEAFCEKPKLSEYSEYVGYSTYEVSKNCNNGAGWSFNIPYMEENNMNYYFHFPGKETYRLQIENNEESLKDYPWKNIEVIIDPVDGSIRRFRGIKDLTTNLKYFFAMDGTLYRIEDNYKNTITFQYSNGNISSITDAIGNTINFDYSDTSKVKVKLNGNESKMYVLNKEEETAPNSTKKVTYLTSIIDPIGRTTSFKYEARIANINLASQVLESCSYCSKPYISLPQLLLEEVTYHTGAKSSYTYLGPINQLTSLNSAKQVFKVSSRLDNSAEGSSYNNVTYTYTGDPFIEAGKALTFQTTVNNGLTSTTYFYSKDYEWYDQSSVFYLESIQVVDKDVKNVTSYTYDKLKRRTVPLTTTITNSQGTSSYSNEYKYEYDDYQNITKETNPLGVAKYTENYDYTINKPLIIRTQVSESGFVKTEFSYNSQGDILTAIKKDENNVTDYEKTYSYDVYGNVIKEILLAPNDKPKIFEYNYDPRYQNSFVTSIKTYATIPNQIESQEIIIYYEYEKETGNLIGIIDGKGFKTISQYDSINRLVKMIYPDNSSVQANYLDLANKIEITNEEGIKSYIKWDSLGNKSSEGFIVNGVEKLKQYYKYDKFSRLTAIGDSLNNETGYSYDTWNNVILTSFPNGTSFINKYNYGLNQTTSIDGSETVEIVTEDNIGRILNKKVTTSNGTVTYESFTYNKFSEKPIETKDAEGNINFYSYDEKGNITSVLDPELKTTLYRYDSFNNLTEIIFPDGKKTLKKYDELNRQIQQIDPKGQIETYFYDKNNNLVSYFNRKGQMYQKEYNSRNWLINDFSPDETITFQYDKSGKRLFAISTIIGKFGYIYNDLGLLEEVTYPDGKQITYSYNTNNLISSLKDPFGKDTFYTYDNLNRLKSVILDSPENSPESTYNYSSSGELINTLYKNGIKSTYSYDGTNRLKGLNYLSNTSEIMNFEYNHDLNHNITEVTKNGIENNFFSYDSLNRIKTSSIFSEVYTYDKRGNRQTLESQQIPDISNKSFKYDSKDRLIELITENEKTIQYRYDIDGLLYERTINGTTTRYYYDGDQIIAEAEIVNGVPKLKNRYIRGLKLILRENSEGEKAYYLYNGHGDTVELRDSAGTKIVEYSYDFWGKPLTVTGQADDNLFLYSGEYWDKEASLQYLRARWYDPNMGRFISEDTFEGYSGNPLSLNLYTYVYNNPLKFIDPTGHDVYIFYGLPHGDNGGFEERAQNEAEWWEANSKEKVHLIPVTSEAEFIEAWNSMGENGASINHVSLYFHSNPHNLIIDYEKNEYITVYKSGKTQNKKGSDGTWVGSLEEKNIRTLVLYACNSGHWDQEDNLAVSFLLNHKIKNVYAWDGNMKWSEDGNSSTLSWDQESFYSWLDSGSDRKPQGLIKYYMKNGKMYYQKVKSSSKVFKRFWPAYIK